MMDFRLMLIVLLVLFSGCTAIGHREPPVDWPKFRITVHQVKVGELFAACYQYIPTWQKLLGAIPEGCATVRFDTMTCDIYVRADSGNGIDKRTLAHEIEHCDGKDHFGSAQLADAWARWKKGPR